MRHFSKTILAFEKSQNEKNRIPKIIDEIKLDFKDVLIQPQLTTLYSRR